MQGGGRRCTSARNDTSGLRCTRRGTPDLLRRVTRQPLAFPIAYPPQRLPAIIATVPSAAATGGTNGFVAAWSIAKRSRIFFAA